MAFIRALVCLQNMCCQVLIHLKAFHYHSYFSKQMGFKDPVTGSMGYFSRSHDPS